jgi:hypothetical protein
VAVMVPHVEKLLIHSWVVVQFGKEASQTRDYCVAKNPSVALALSGQAATHRAARPDSLGKLGTCSSLHKKRLLRMTITTVPLRLLIGRGVLG